MDSDESIIATKTCTKCHETKLETDFPFKRTPTNPHYRQAQCKSCHNMMNALHRHKDLEGYNAKIRKRRKERGEAYQKVSRAWRDANPEKVRQYWQTDSMRHKEQKYARARAYHAQHRERIREQKKTYREQNKEKISQAHKEWRENNTDYLRQYRRRVDATNKQARRARKHQAPRNDLTQKQWQEIKDAYGHRCAYCGRKMQRLTIDHVTPYVHNGSNTIWNVVPSCQTCNSKKGTRPPPKPVQPLLLTIAPAKKKRPPS